MTFKEYCISNISNLKKQFKFYMGYDLNLDNPQTLCEKLNWLKIYDSTFLKTYCADKLLVRDYVKDKLNIDLSIPIIGIYDKFEQINFPKLPKDYVIKCNHGSGMNLIVKNGELNINDVKNKLNSWMNMEWIQLYEFHYKPIQKKIFIEQYMENKGKNSLTDYKFSCFNGEPKFCQVMNDRFTNNLHFNYYDLNFNPMLDVSRNDHPANYSLKDEKPVNWDLMIEYSKKLCKDFKYVRVDFYQINNKIYFGELTFIPQGGYIKYKNKDTDLELGKLLKI